MALFSLCRAKVIVAEGVRPTIVARIIKIWNRNAKILNVAHGYPLAVHSLTFKDKLIKQFLKKTDGIIAVSQLQRDHIFNNFGIRCVPISVCHPDVSMEAFLSVTQEYGKENNVVFLGALERIKGADLLFDIFKKITY